MVTSPIESFNNVVSSHADKRIIWGRGWTYRTLVAISILEHNLGPGWMLMAIRELLGHEPSKATKHAVERIAYRKARMREYRKPSEAPFTRPARTDRTGEDHSSAPASEPR